MQTPLLRPLGAGELLDRAVTLFVRRFVPIVLVLAVVSVPLLVVQAFIAPDPVSAFDIIGRLGGHNARPSPATLHQLNEMNLANMRLALISAVLHLLQWSALVAVIAAAYAGTSVGLAAAYRTGLHRWIAQLVLGLIYLVIGIVASIPWFVAYIVLVMVVAFSASARVDALSIGMAVIAGLAIVALAVVTISWIFIAYELASVAVVTELPNPIAAASAGLRRAFGAPTRWRSLVAGMVALAVNFVASVPLLAVGATLSALTHVRALYYGVAGVGEVLVQGLLGAFIVIYAVDVRVRRQGIDLLPSAVDEASLGAASG